MISVVILAKNEERNIGDCLANLAWCSEIIVIDDYSTDKTSNIAKKYGVYIYKRHLNSDFASQRNFGLSKAANDWVLFVDADERISKLLSREILQKTKNTNYGGFYIKRNDYFMGRELKYGETGNIKLLRLARKGKWKRKVHEYWDAGNNVGELKNPILHYHNQSLTEFIDKINNYSNIHAYENKKEGKYSNIWKIIFFPLGKFLYNFIFRLGFLDGVEGLIMAVMMSFHSFLSWSKQSNLK